MADPLLIDPASAGLPAGLVAFIMAFLVVFVVLYLVYYIVTALALMTLAKKTNTPNEWLAFVPIGRWYLLTQIGKLPGVYTLLVFLMFVPFVGSWLQMAVIGYFWGKASEARNKPVWLGVIAAIPLIGSFIVSIVLAWTD